jgi:hypothetical protein
VLGCGAVADGELVEPAASRFSGWLVEAGDVGLEVDDGCPVNEIDACEHDGGAGHLEELDEADSDRIDSPGPASSEDAHRAALAAQQEWDLPQRGVAGGVARAVQPGIVEIREPVQTFPLAVGDLQGPVLGAVETCLDRCRHGLCMGGTHDTYCLQGDVQVRCLRLS